MVVLSSCSVLEIKNRDLPMRDEELGPVLSALSVLQVSTEAQPWVHHAQPILSFRDACKACRC